MQDALNSMEVSLAGLETAEWKTSLMQLAEDHGMTQQLGDKHFATFIDARSTLLVTFETVQGIRALSETAHPVGFDMVRAQGVSHLCIISDGDTWFRDQKVYGFFDKLIDDGFFEEFDNIVFYGAGPCGYAAAAFSVAAPGSTVVAIQPQATLDPRMTEWDDRFTDMRRISFTDRFGYAPDMLDAAEEAFVIYDPRQPLDAMHASLFARSNVTRLRTPNLGASLQTNMMDMRILYPILALAGCGRLNRHTFAKLYRARRDNKKYLRHLVGRLDAEERPYLNALVCRNVTCRMHAPMFRRRLQGLEEQAAAGEFTMPIAS